MAWPKGVPRKKILPEVQEIGLDDGPPDETNVEVLDPLATLKLKAETALDSRGHELGDWQDGPGSSLAICTRCGGKAGVRAKDEKKGIFHCDEKASVACA